MDATTTATAALELRGITKEFGDLVATALKSPPSISVALVKTTVLSESSLSRIGPHTSSGATQSRGGNRSPPSASQSTSDSRSAAIRSALTNTSCTDPRAWVRPASPSPESLSLGYAERQARAASRTCCS